MVSQSEKVQEVEADDSKDEKAREELTLQQEGVKKDANVVGGIPHLIISNLAR